MKSAYKIFFAAAISVISTAAVADEWSYDFSTDAMRGTTKKIGAALK